MSPHASPFWRRLLALVLPIAILACRDDPTAPANAPVEVPRFKPEPPDAALITAVRALAVSRGIGRLPGPPRVRTPLVLLGQALVFDPILSGNRDISCATCHLPGFATSDGRSLAIGQGGSLLGPARTHAQGTFIPRNAPPLFNMSGMQSVFWDGRVEREASGSIRTPAGSQIDPSMNAVFEFGAISALGMFPVMNRAEMRAGSGNELAAIPDDRPRDIWNALMRRLGAYAEYRDLFLSAYPGTRWESMTFAHASNAMAAFFVDQFSFADSPWDRFLAGQDAALTPEQLLGAQTFLTLKCSICHSGATLSDQQFHNVAVAQIGPGQGNGASLRDDFGRENVTGLLSDRYRFRTTPLRNVELTAPYGHDGAIMGLRDFVEHYSESHLKLMTYDPGQLEPLLRGTVVDNKADILANRDPLLEGVVLPSDLVDKLMGYMLALTDDRARDMSKFVPTRVPSGLPVGLPRR